MHVVFLLIIVVLAAAILLGMTSYNRLIEIKHNVSRAWANIDVLLKQRHDELPKLVEACKQYMKHEQETLERIMKARSAVSQARIAGDVTALGNAETQLRGGLGNLFTLVESYPELQADKHFRNLYTRITALESAIADRREFYNDSVTINNTRLEQFPNTLLTRWFGNFQSYKLLQFAEEDIRDVDLKQLFG